MENAKELQKIIKEYKDVKGGLVAVLQKAQDACGYLSEDVQKAIADGLDIPLAEVFGVATFYSQFRLEPTGKYQISVCMGTACYVKGAGDILERLKEKLGIDINEVTEDGLFTIVDTRCIGACGLAPLIAINDDVYGHIKMEGLDKQLDDILEKYREVEA